MYQDEDAEELGGRRRKGVKEYEDEMRVFQMGGSDDEDDVKASKKRISKSSANNVDSERPRKMRDATG